MWRKVETYPLGEIWIVYFTCPPACEMEQSYLSLHGYYFNLHTHKQLFVYHFIHLCVPFWGGWDLIKNLFPFTQKLSISCSTQKLSISCSMLVLLGPLLFKSNSTLQLAMAPEKNSTQMAWTCLNFEDSKTRIPVLYTCVTRNFQNIP